MMMMMMFSSSWRRICTPQERVCLALVKAGAWRSSPRAARRLSSCVLGRSRDHHFYRQYNLSRTTTTLPGNSNLHDRIRYYSNIDSSDEVTMWKDATSRLLTRPWTLESSSSSPLSWKEEARRTLDWWTQHSGGGLFTIKILERLQQEMSSMQASSNNYNNNAEKDLSEILADPGRVRAIVQRWAWDYNDAQPPHGIADPSEVSTLFESFRNINRKMIDQSIFDFIHRTSVRRELLQQWGPFSNDESSSSSSSSSFLHQENLLWALSHVEQTGDFSSIPCKLNQLLAQIDKILRMAVKDEKDVSRRGGQRHNQSQQPTNDNNDLVAIAQWAQNILDTMWSIRRKFDCPKIRPDHSIYQSVLRAWLKSDEPSKSSNMQRLLDEMESISYTGEETGLFPGRIHFVLLLSAYAEDGNIKGALELMRHIIHRYKATGVANYEPSSQMYGVCAAALSQSEDPDAALEMVEKFLEEMNDAYLVKQNKMLLPRKPFWTSYIGILANVGKTESLEKAEDMLGELYTDKGRIRPNRHHYGALIRGWARLKQPERAEVLLHRMNQQFIDGHREAQPDAKNFLDVINAWSESGSPDAHNRISHLTRLMSSSGGGKPNIHSINDNDDGLLKMLSTAAGRGDAQQAERLLREKTREYDKGNGGILLSQQHYQAVITAWSKTVGKHSLDCARALLSEMLARYDAGDENFRPQEHGFTAVIAAYARSGRNDCGEGAQKLFDEMQRRYKEGEKSLRPSVRSYSALIKAWSSQGRPDRSELLLQLMHDDFLGGNHAAKPNETAFNTVLSAWSKVKSEEALERSTQILRLMQDLKRSELQVSPDIYSYASTIACCIQSNAPDRVEVAESLLQEAKNRYAKGQAKCRPNCMIYGAVIQTIARSKSEGSAEHAEYYLREMLTLSDFDPRQILLSHNAVIGAWAKESNLSVALARAEGLVGNLIELSREHRCKQCLPNKFTYALLLQIVSRSPPSDRQPRAKAAMREMEQLGVEADDVVRRLVARCIR